MTDQDTIRELVDIVLEQQESIMLLLQANQSGQQFDKDQIEEMLERGRRIQTKVYQCLEQDTQISGHLKKERAYLKLSADIWYQIQMSIMPA